jgi:hypothetical protein
MTGGSAASGGATTSTVSVASSPVSPAAGASVSVVGSSSPAASPSDVDDETSAVLPAGFDESDADPPGEVPDEVPEDEESDDEESDGDDESPVGSAYAIPGVEATAAPTPSATANAPTRPTCLA